MTPKPVAHPSSGHFAQVMRVVELPHVSSGSALELHDGALYITSDDAAYLYRYHLATGRVDSIALSFLPTNAHRIPKPEKPDFEASVLTMLEEVPNVVAFGSGSAGPQREVIAYLPLQGDQPTLAFLAERFYESLRQAAGIEKKDFNIEAAVRIKDQILFFNRGSQQMLECDWNALDGNLRLGGPLPAIRTTALPLPPEKKAGYSGASTLPGNSGSPDRIVFSASQEETTDWYQDGVITGSAIGLLERAGNQSWKITGYYPVTDASGKQLPLKVEGVVADPQNGQNHFIAVTDNDDGTSKLLWIEIR